MTRSHVEFIHEQVLPWSAGLPGDGRPGVSVRTLSLDEDTGGCSLVIRYPPRWERPQVEHLLADEEFFVVEGSLEIGGVAHDRLGYGFLPAGHVRRGARSPRGALVVTFFEEEPRPVPGEPAGATGATAAAAAGRDAVHVSALEGEWTGNFHPLFPLGAGRKFLRQDPLTGEQTWILGTMPLRSGRRPEKHPVVEEMFLLSGELVGNLGVMHAGAYFWRPPEIWHGPYGSQTGNLMLFRTRGGPLSTVYTETEQDFDWRPAHRPILPPDLAGPGGTPYSGRAPF